VGTVAAQSLTVVNNVLNIIPGVAPLRSTAENAAYERRDATIRLAEDKNVKAESQYLPTVR
jgi:hypothetical protein